MWAKPNDGRGVTLRFQIAGSGQRASWGHRPPGECGVMRIDLISGVHLPQPLMVHYWKTEVSVVRRFGWHAAHAGKPTSDRFAAPGYAARRASLWRCGAACCRWMRARVTGYRAKSVSRGSAARACRNCKDETCAQSWAQPAQARPTPMIVAYDGYRGFERSFNSI
jgi:hypothetical protein